MAMGKTRINKSIFAGDDISVCYRCGKMCIPDEGRMDEHHIFEGANRHTSDKYGLLIHVCRDCHMFIHSKDGKEIRDYLHRAGQELYEDRYGSRQDFIKDFIQSYL